MEHKVRIVLIKLDHTYREADPRDQPVWVILKLLVKEDEQACETYQCSSYESHGHSSVKGVALLVEAG